MPHSTLELSIKILSFLSSLDLPLPRVLWLEGIFKHAYHLGLFGNILTTQTLTLEAKKENT